MTAISAIAETVTSVRERLAERINAAIARAGKMPLPIVVEINTGDPAKAGLCPHSSELEELLRAAGRLPYLRVQGLMSVPPFTEEPEGARPYSAACANCA